MSIFHSDKPVLCKVHGFCVAGGTDFAARAADAGFKEAVRERDAPYEQ